MDGEHPFSSPDTVPFPQTRHICAIIILSSLACSLQSSSAVRGRVSQHFVEISFRGHALGNNERDVALRIQKGLLRALLSASCFHPKWLNFYLQGNVAIKNKSSKSFFSGFESLINDFLDVPLKLLNTSLLQFPYCKMKTNENIIYFTQLLRRISEYIQMKPKSRTQNLHWLGRCCHYHPFLLRTWSRYPRYRHKIEESSFQ